MRYSYQTSSYFSLELYWIGCLLCETNYSLLFLFLVIFVLNLLTPYTPTRVTPFLISIKQIKKNLQLRRAFHDWELEGICSLFQHLYSNMPRGEGGGLLSWKLTRSGVFDVRSYYNFLCFVQPSLRAFPWKSIWGLKVPKRVSFFLWTATWDAILTIDNLVKRGQPMVNCCFLCCYVGGKL